MEKKEPVYAFPYRKQRVGRGVSYAKLMALKSMIYDKVSLFKRKSLTNHAVFCLLKTGADFLLNSDRYQVYMHNYMCVYIHKKNRISLFYFYMLMWWMRMPYICSLPKQQFIAEQHIYSFISFLICLWQMLTEKLLSYYLAYTLKIQEHSENLHVHKQWAGLFCAEK